MRFGKLAIFTSIAAVLGTPAIAATRTHHTAPAHKLSASSSKSTKHVAAKPKFQSQRGIDDQRATEIQEALIRDGYLSGEPSGRWDSASEAAMQKVQADNGWQTKLVPDSRALIKLGLGPTSSLPVPSASSGESASSGSLTQGHR